MFWLMIGYDLPSYCLENNVINARLKVDSREKLIHIYKVHGAVRDRNLH